MSNNEFFKVWGLYNLENAANNRFYIVDCQTHEVVAFFPDYPAAFFYATKMNEEKAATVRGA